MKNKNRKLILKFLYFAVFYCILLFGFLPRLVFAQGGDDDSLLKTFEKANNFYKENKYNEAILEYEKVVSQGFESGNLYYNLANSYFKKGEAGRAVLNYERARQFIPGDGDLKSNYDFVRSILNLNSQGLSGNRLEKGVDKLSAGISINGITVVLAVLYAAIILILIFSLFFPQIKRPAGILIVILAGFFVLGAVSLKRKMIYLYKGAVVISKVAAVKFEPLENATAYFELTEGSFVEAVEEGGNWEKIKRADGKIGWIDKAAIELIRNIPKEGVGK